MTVLLFVLFPVCVLAVTVAAFVVRHFWDRWR